MTKKNILHMVTPLKHVSPFDVNMAVDAGYDAVVPYTHASAEEVAGLVQDAIFSRPPKTGARTAMFFGGKDALLALDMMSAAGKAMVPPFAISLFADPSGSFTTAAAAIARIEKTLAAKTGRDLGGLRMAVFGGTGVVGFAAALIAALEGADVALVGYDGLKRVSAAAAEMKARFDATVRPADGSDEAKKAAILAGAEAVLSAGRAGVRVLSRDQIAGAPGLLVAADVNAVPPAGIEGLEAMADGAELTAGGAVGIGPLAIGGLKYRTEAGLFERMIAADKAVRLDFRDAFLLARALDAEPAHVLVAAMSGRALAVSARRGGYVPLVADFFADEDTAAAAGGCVRLPGSLAAGMEAGALLAALDDLAGTRRPLGVVCGTGFEDRPQLLARIAERWPLLGNRPGTVAAVKDPPRFAALCRDCGIPHPEVSMLPPGEPAGWLAKRPGGAGGSHIAAADRGPGTAGRYFQRRVAGAPVSAQFVSDGRRTVVLGFSSQWAAPAPDRPFRYGGAVRPATLAPGLADALAMAVATLAAAAGLVGLNSADFLVDGEDFRLIEVNPRPGAVLDIFEPPEGSLFAMHVAACAGRLPAAPPRATGAAATAVAYADREIAALGVRDWPDWIADRPRPGTSFAAGEPFCTVRAAGPTAATAQALLAERLAMVAEWMHAR